jgi:hypothetical protein
MTTPEQIFDQAAADLFSASGLGVAGIFAPDDGSASFGLYVNLEREVDLQPDGYGAQAWAGGWTVEYVLSVIGREARSGETFTIGTSTYTVRRVLENDGRYCKCAVQA